jgi:putative phage-type endonuclease
MELIKEQLSDDWFKARDNCITGSQFNDVLNGTPTTWARIIAEKNGTAERFRGNKATEWGTKYEPEAIDLFSFQEQVDVVRTGFWVCDDNPFIGGSPDGLIGSDHLIEVKCPFNPDVHLKTYREKKIPGKYVPQVQGNLGITGRRFAWFISYDPRASVETKLVKILVARDDAYIESLFTRLNLFLECWKNGKDPLDYFELPGKVDLDNMPKLF